MPPHHRRNRRKNKSVFFDELQNFKINNKDIIEKALGGRKQLNKSAEHARPPPVHQRKTLNEEERHRAIAIFDQESADELVEKKCDNSESSSYLQALTSMRGQEVK